MSFRRVLRRIYKPSRDILQRLDRLERSSPDFPDQLTNLLSGQEYGQHIFTDALREEGAAWLVEYLDNVRVSFSLYPLSTEYA